MGAYQQASTSQMVAVAYDLVIDRDPGGVQRGFGESGLLPVLPLVYVTFPVLDTDTPQLLFQATPFDGLLLSFFTRSEISRHELPP